MKARHPVFLSLLILYLLAIPVSSVEGASDELVEGQHPLYIIKQVVETTSDWTQVEWIQSPDLIVPRYRILEGSDAPGLEWVKRGLSYWLHKEDTGRVVIEVEALAFRGDDAALVEVSRMNAGAAEGYVRSEFYVYNRTIGDFTKLGEVFLEEGNHGPVSFEHDLSTFYDTPSATANVEKAVKELDKKVLAFYYNWYSPWIDPPPGEWSQPVADTPFMGPYYSSDERVIQAQMAMAKYASIDVFIADCSSPGSIQAENMPTVLRLAEENGLLISTYSVVQPLTLATHPAWLRDAGRPVFFHWNPAKYDPSDWLEWRAQLEESIGPVVWIGNTIDEEYLGVFDGFHSYLCVPHIPGDDSGDHYRENIERMRVGPNKKDLDEAFSLAYTGGEVRLDLKSFSVSVIPGYDDTKIRSPGAKTDREEGALYERMWRMAIGLDAHSVLITSWNEWMEGTEIEPSVEYGFEYVNLARGFIEEYKQTSIATPEVDFSVGVDSLLQRPDLSGNGRIVITVAEFSAHNGHGDPDILDILDWKLSQVLQDGDVRHPARPTTRAKIFHAIVGY